MAADLNEVNIIGRLVKNIDVSHLKSGTAAGAFTIAVNDFKKNGDQYDKICYFIDCNWYGKPVEALAQYLTKGRQVAVHGSLHQDRWEKDGQKFSRVKVAVESLQLLAAPTAQNGDATPYEGGSTQDDFPEDIPF